MWRIIKVLIVLAILAFAAFSGYAYLVDLTPTQKDVTVPVILNAE